LPNEKGKIDLAKLMQILADFEINEVLVEAGNRLNGAFIRAGLVDELVIYLAPHLIGNRAMGMLQLPELTDLSEKYNLKIKDLRMVGEDIRIMTRFL
jgi:diaminohydroxyphosphoribosylaminopyrimidine deaminase/5-amino-6-(5-phosphoribosylamino)uracil reductase